MDGGVMDDRWRDIGDDGDEDLLQIPIPAGCQNGVSGSKFAISDGGGAVKVYLGKTPSPRYFQVKGYM
jgi:hypothetical protein